MLDYSGFKLSILAAGPTADWAAIGATAKDSDSNWSALAKNVRDSGIRDLAAAIQDGLRSAVARKDIEGVKFAAKLQLGIVDVLEDTSNAPRADKQKRRSLSAVGIAPLSSLA